ncbi:MAG: NACHT domain-containing protein [Gemmatimonadetes bacterium]|nr:NACHT domain-containing protein [Gemmatimonadota bacterium]
MFASSKEITRFWVPSEESPIPIPVITRPQFLPLNELTWDCFQRLCARLAQRFGDVEHVQEYGIPGQRQEGIDIYVRRKETSKYSVWQCKRYQELKPSQITDAVTSFLDGTWAEDTDELILAVSIKTEQTNLAKAIEKQAARLRELSIVFRPFGITQLSEHLKDHPDLVDDFFGREWVRSYCGEKAAVELSGRRLNPADVIRLRQLLRRCYAEHFEITDPGIPSVAGTFDPNLKPLQLPNRFVPPDVEVERQVTHTHELLEEENVSQPYQDKSRSNYEEFEDSTKPRRTHATTRNSIVRFPAINWLSESDLTVVLGNPGIGKSTLLRCVILDLLSTEPSYKLCVQRWGQYLPVWVPFAMWTRLVGESEAECSLSDVLTLWLRKVSASDELVSLVQEALEDSRLLLFIDGLDEWSNATAAQTTLTLLDHFVGERNVPAIASSRPLGYARIGGLSSRWRKGFLAGLTREQQCTLAERWFLHRSNTLTMSDDENSSFELKQSRVKVEAVSFIRDLHHDVRLARLAEVPLLLNGLVALAVQTVSLPRSRFKAYEVLTRLLMEEQPKRREKAAHAPRATTKLNMETRERALARLAWETHNSPGSDALNKSDARETLMDFCASYLCKPQNDAFEIAEELLSIGSETIGILVDKSPEDIGFLHRSFQEYLTAKYLSNLPIEEQKRILKVRFENLQWHGVFLCLCYLNTRDGEVDSFVAVIESLELPFEMELERKGFLAEIAFGDLHCSPGCARKLASETFEIIETGVHNRTRERLLELALDGLESDVLRPLVESRIRLWFPRRHTFRSGLYESMASWSNDDNTLDALWRGLLDEEETSQRSAAQAIAKVYGEDQDVASRLMGLITKPTEPLLMAHALHSLCLGWESEGRLPRILDLARSSADTAFKSVALIHRVRRKEHDAKDRETLISLAQGYDFASWIWQEDRIRALINGWPNDVRIKNDAISSIKHDRNGRVFDSEAIGIILLEGFPQDKDVAEAIAKLFQSEDYPSHFLGLHFSYGWINKAFGGNRYLGPVIEDWLEQKFDRLHWEFELALFTRSDRAKRLLLRPNLETGVISENQAKWLLQGWGMKDKDAAAALRNFADSDSAKKAAHLLPDILQDNKLCRQRLFEILQNEPEYVARYAINGMAKLGPENLENGILELAATKFANEVPSGGSYRGVSDLIRHFPNHPEVRKLALHQLENRGGDVSTVAMTYSSSDMFRCKLYKLCITLPAYLRLLVVDRLTRLSPDDDFSHNLLSEYDEDIDENVKTAAAIGYATSVKRREKVSKSLLDELTDHLTVTGPDLGERRLAAFAGLLELDRLDIVQEAWPQNEKTHIAVGGGLRTNVRLCEHLVRHWNRVSMEFGKGFWERIGWVPDEFLEEMITRTTNPSLVKEITEMISSKGTSVRLLRLYSEQLKGTVRLRDLCLETLGANIYGQSWIEHSPSIYAAEILADQFNNDVKTYNELDKLVQQGAVSSALVIALSAGWPNTDAWAKTIKQVVFSKLLPPAKLHLLAASTPPNEFLEKSCSIIETLSGDIWDFVPVCSRAVASRFEHDNLVRELAIDRLCSHPSSFEKVNLPSFLLVTEENQERLRAWMCSEINQQSECNQVAEVALDLATESVRPVCYVLMENLIT